MALLVEGIFADGHILYLLKCHRGGVLIKLLHWNHIEIQLTGVILRLQQDVMKDDFKTRRRVVIKGSNANQMPQLWGKL